jgi:hypothetical protein
MAAHGRLATSFYFLQITKVYNRVLISTTNDIFNEKSRCKPLLFVCGVYRLKCEFILQSRQSCRAHGPPSPASAWPPSPAHFSPAGFTFDHNQSSPFFLHAIFGVAIIAVIAVGFVLINTNRVSLGGG